MSKDVSRDVGTAAAEAGSPSQLEREIEEARERLAGTIDLLVHRANPKTIATRQVGAVRAYFVDRVTGQPRTENILKVAGGLAGTVLLFVAVRRATR